MWLDDDLGLHVNHSCKSFERLRLHLKGWIAFVVSV